MHTKFWQETTLKTQSPPEETPKRFYIWMAQRNHTRQHMGHLSMQLDFVTIACTTYG